MNPVRSEDSVWSDRTFTHAGRLQGVATVSIAVELGPVELEHPALRLVVQSHCNQRTVSMVTVRRGDGTFKFQTGSSG